MHTSNESITFAMVPRTNVCEVDVDLTYIMAMSSSSIIVQFLPADVEYDFNLYEVLLSECNPASPSVSSGHSSVCYANKVSNYTFGKFQNLIESSISQNQNAHSKM